MSNVANTPIFDRNAKTEPAKPVGLNGPVQGRLEVTIKINEFPRDVREVQDGWKQFRVACDRRLVTVTLRPKAYKKLTEAQANWTEWVAVISGKMGPTTKDGFELVEPAVQVFEKKPPAAQPLPASAV